MDPIMKEENTQIDIVKIQNPNTKVDQNNKTTYKEIHENSEKDIDVLHNEQVVVDLPLKPDKPDESDCCGTGCVPCVFDIYDQEIKIWENECIRIRNGAIFGKVDWSEDTVLSELEYKQFCIGCIDEETKDTKRYRFTISNNSSLGLKVGQHIVIRAQTDNETITRQYTPLSDITNRGHFDLLIKLYKHGKMSRVIQNWQVGDKIDIRGPFGTFDYSAGKSPYILMLAAGTGIAPMSQIIHQILDNENDETIIHLLYACHTYQDILMKKELDELSGYWNFSVTYVLSQEGEGQYKYGDKIFKGKIDVNLIEKELDGKTFNRGLALICGTRLFDEDMIEYCQKVGFYSKQIFKF